MGVMRKHDLTNKKDNDKDKYKDNDNDNENEKYISRTPSKSDLWEFLTFETFHQSDEKTSFWPFQTKLMGVDQIFTISAKFDNTGIPGILGIDTWS